MNVGMGPNADKTLDAEDLKDVLDLTKSEQEAVFNGVVALSGTVDDLTREILGAAKNEQVKNKKQAHEADIAGTILYVLGWSLGLLGKIKNKED